MRVWTLGEIISTTQDIIITQAAHARPKTAGAAIDRPCVAVAANARSVPASSPNPLALVSFVPSPLRERARVRVKCSPLSADLDAKLRREESSYLG